MHCDRYGYSPSEALCDATRMTHVNGLYGGLMRPESDVCTINRG